MLSVGVSAELMLRSPWFPGETDIDQLGKIFQCLGTPNMEEWPDHIYLPHYLEYKQTAAIPLHQIFRNVSSLKNQIHSGVRSLACNLLVVLVRTPP